MAVIVPRSNVVQINNAEDCLNYLDFIYVSQWDPFTIHTQVRITNRFGLPSDVGSYNVGLFSFGKINRPIVNLLVLMDSGTFTVMSVAKVNVARRT